MVVEQLADIMVRIKAGFSVHGVIPLFINLSSYKTKNHRVPTH